ncbi:Long-chain-fatty-acid--CoA ligase FadD15 [Botrimarina colliarenosi]|uniref:Long-chain-fatty-acid--CoA ligase FadD15 n=1 Tax=Botrimarina colliarenosi TaxID=2528001 RepID=A0A5C6AMH2_9BACT|nr:AMP-dependent synthetase/ligase [Botrimarina colliarenosi]TWU00698.1 Long-chain-fatty-acid--CoA ligase FadD15 [Botrimarina colliarenosi]
MPAITPTIAELIDAVRDEQADKQALGRIESNVVAWARWKEISKGRLSGEAWWRWLEPFETVVVETAGTSGEPRGVMLTEKNLASNAIALSEASGGDGDELRLSFLPMEHLYARTCDLYTWIVRGSRLVLAESPKTVFRDAKLVKPTVINGVPYFFQKAIDLAEQERVSLRELLGGEIKRCYCGGAPLAPSVEQRFFDEGVPLYNGYGLTEASPVVTVNTPTAYKLGTVGKPLPGVEVCIASDGEILVGGPNVMLGYYNDPEATAAALRDGWLHTGDLGELDSDGFLTITGRKKELIVLATGKNVAPSRVEALLGASPWIEQACVLGDDRKGLRALIVPNRDRLRAEIKRRRLWVWSKRGALRHQAIRTLYREVIDACLAGASPEEQVHTFALIGRGFDRDLGEMTAKLSLRRDVIAKSFARELR